MPYGIFENQWEEPMLSKHFAILALLAGLPAVAQEPAAAVSPSTTAIPMHHNGPMRVYGAPESGIVKSPDWGGYAVTGSGFTKVLGSWIAPTVNCTETSDALSSYWVGMDGYSNATVEQIGTEADCSGSTPSYYAWFDFFPAPRQLIPSIKVSPGDKMSATVSYSGGIFTLKMTNHTTGKAFQWAQAVSADRTSAEWIVYGFDPLADFTSVSLGDDYTRVNDTNWAVDTAVTGPISDFGTKVHKVKLVDSNGTVKANPSALTTDGSSFKITWKSE
jgi:hypothetical protein